METVEVKSAPSYEMFSKAGDKMCHSLVSRIEKKVKGKYRVTKEEILQMVKDGMKKIGEKHGEVTDTEPEYHICSRVSSFCKEVGYDFEISRYEL